MDARVRATRSFHPLCVRRCQALIASNYRLHRDCDAFSMFADSRAKVATRIS